MPGRFTIDWRNRDGAFWPLAALALLAALQFSLIFTRAINWDEYSYYREVAWFSQGILERPLQTIHVRLFAWLPGLFATSTDHIVAARAVTFGCEMVTLASLYLVARNFAERKIALFAPLLYLSAGFAFQHGMAFRVDALSASLACASLAVLANARLNWLAIAGFGLLAGLAAMVTIKVVLYAPAFAGIAWWRATQGGWRWNAVIRLALCGLAAVAAFGALYAWHATGMAPTATVSAAGSGTSAPNQVSDAGNYAFFLGVPLYWHFILKAAAVAPVLTVMIVMLPWHLWRSGGSLAHTLALLGLWLPIASLLFYTNTLPYFYAFILAPVAISVLPLVERVVARYGALLFATVLALMGVGIWLTEDRAIIDRQRQLEHNVHEVLQTPVTYFDHNYMLGSWPKGNGFLTRWGLANYTAAGVPAFREAMERQTIPLFLANYPELEMMISGEADGLLFPADEAALRGNYIEFAWPIWVAGKDYAQRRGAFADEFLIPGQYTLEGGPITLDGQRLNDGAVITIARGVHQVQVDEAAARLVWGDHLLRPQNPLVEGPLYVLF